MKNSLSRTGVTALACAMSLWTSQVMLAADVTVSATTNMGTIEEFAPGSDVILRSESSADPLRYSVSSRTIYVDEAGAPVAVERIQRGTPVTVHYVREGDRMIADRVIVRHTPSTVTERRTITTTTRPLTEDEREAREEAREEAKDRLEERIEHRKERLDDLKDRLEDDDD